MDKVFILLGVCTVAPFAIAYALIRLFERETRR
jgi:hypothetical protein